MTADEALSSMATTDLAEYLAVCAEVASEAGKVDGVLVKLNGDLLADDAVDRAKGLGILNVKNQLMLDYLINLSYAMLLKTSGKALEGDSAVARIVTDRTVLEKIRPIEQKLRYQIDKAVKVAETGEMNTDDPIHFKANPSAMVSKLGSGSEDEDENEEGDESKMKKKDSKYVVPKHVPVFFEGEGGEGDDEAGARKGRKQQLSKVLIDDLKRQHLDTPEEVYEAEDIMKKRRVEVARERTRYEEENFIRLPVTKKEKKQNRKRGGMSTMGTIGDEVTAFGRNYFNAADPETDKKRKGKAFGGASRKKKFRK